MKLTMIIGQAPDGTFGAYAENVEGVYGMGATAEDAKNEALKGLAIMKRTAPDQLPKWVLADNYDLAIQYDTVSLLNTYKSIFTLAGIERITGINQRQLSHYLSGLKKPRPAQRKKIEEGLHQLGRELIAIGL